MLIPHCNESRLFNSEEGAILKWLRSPQRDIKSGQWITTGVFATNSGAIEESNFLWKNLPVLRLGWGTESFKLPIQNVNWGARKSFENPKYFCGEVVNLEIKFEIGVCQANDLSELRKYLSSHVLNCKEQCITLMSSHGPVVVTALECIRAFLVGHSPLAEGMLEPNYLERILRSYELTSKTLKLEFSEDISAKDITHTLVVCIAQIISDSSFKKSWNAIYYNRRLAAKNEHWNSPIPLITQLPGLSRFWKVRLISLGEINLILEIISASFEKLPKFNTIEYTHPKFRKSFYEYRFQQRGIQISDDKPLFLESSLRLSRNTQSENIIFNFFRENQIRMVKRIMS